jgi:hypothetical protein
MRCTRLCPLNPDVTKVVSEEMLNVGRNLDRTGQPLLTYLCYSDSFSKLFLIFSHLFPLYSYYSYPFSSKDKMWISHIEITYLSDL